MLSAHDMVLSGPPPHQPVAPPPHLGELLHHQDWVVGTYRCTSSHLIHHISFSGFRFKNSTNALWGSAVKGGGN